MVLAPQIGLKDVELKRLISVFEKTPAISEAILFGSRALGKHRSASDVDIVLKGKPKP